jgi:hypothetical protein
MCRRGCACMPCHEWSAATRAGGAGVSTVSPASRVLDKPGDVSRKLYNPVPLHPSVQGRAYLLK